jgi:hypothetical protein
MTDLKILIFVLCTWTFPQTVVAEVPDRYFIETFLKGSTTDLMNKEAVVVKKLSTLSLLANITSSNLRASNLSINFTNLIDTYATKVHEIRTMKDFNSVNLNLVNLSMYDYTQFRISTIISDIKNMKAIKDMSIKHNSTILYGFANEVKKYYLQNYRTMIKLRSKNKLINTFYREILSFFSVQGSYVQFLNIQIRNYEKLKTYLGNLIISKIIPAPTNVTVDPFISSVRGIESKLVSAQQQVITMAKVASRKVTEALKTVA